MNAETIIQEIRSLPVTERTRVFELIHQLEDQEIPNSFWEGLADCEAGRVVDMEVALSEPPPK